MEIFLGTAVTVVVVVLAVIGGFTVWAAWGRWWNRLASPARTLLVELALLPLVIVMVALVAGVGLLGLDWLLRVSTSWGGFNDRTLIVLSLLVAAVVAAWALFDDLAQFAFDREREARRRAPDPRLDALEGELRATLGEEEYADLIRSLDVIFTYFPGLFDSLDAEVAYDQIKKILRPHPELKNRFLARIGPAYRARMDAYYGMAPRVRWQRVGAIRRLLARGSRRSTTA